MSRKASTRIVAVCAALLTTASLTACAGGSTTASNGSKAVSYTHLTLPTKA